MTFLKDKSIYVAIIFIFLFFLQGIFKLPVIDRDEARFASASKTMIESSDYIDIKMNEETRYKKPIGIYWIQSTFNFLFSSKPYDKIWTYRLPSLVGIILSLCILSYFLSLIYNRKVAFLNLIFLSSSLLTISEVHQAKTDGMLFLTVCICNLLIFSGLDKGNLSPKKKFTFWVFLAFGVLIKGPIIFVFVFFPLIIVSFIKKINYFKLLWSFNSFIVFLLISIPWFILITIKSNGLFWYESFVNDLLNKVKSGQESHGFPPGYYSILIFLFFWPASIFVPNYLCKIKKFFSRDTKVELTELYLMIWFIAPFILFEIIPTKLPHYIYPSYIPLSILIAKMLDKINVSSEVLKYTLVPIMVYPIVVISLLFFAINEYSVVDTYSILIFSILLMIFAYLLFYLFKKNLKKIIILGVTFQTTFYLILVYFMVPKLEKFWISEKINSIIDSRKIGYDAIFHYGFNEPSLMFLVSHKSEKASPADLESQKLLSKKVLFILADDYSQVISKDNSFSNFSLIDQFVGFNYTRGKEVQIKVFSN